jgi:hypothetical protein
MMMVNGFCLILYQVKVKMLDGISISRLILSEEISDGSEAVVHDCSPSSCWNDLRLDKLKPDPQNWREPLDGRKITRLRGSIAL